MTTRTPSEPTYRIIFQQQGDIFEIYASYIYQSELYGFIEVEQLLFGEGAQGELDSEEEKLKETLADVKRTFIPMNSIIRIDEVEKEGTPKVSKGDGSNVTPFPVMSFPPRDND